MASGTSSSNGILAGGETPAGPTTYANTESWNGSAWTELNDLNQARAYGGSSTNSPNGETLVFGGSTSATVPLYANTESWNGTSWTEVNDLATARRSAARAGASTSSALYAGGYSTAVQSVTEEWTVPITNSTLTVS